MNPGSSGRPRKPGKRAGSRWVYKYATMGLERAYYALGELKKGGKAYNRLLKIVDYKRKNANKNHTYTADQKWKRVGNDPVYRVLWLVAAGHAAEGDGAAAQDLIKPLLKIRENRMTRKEYLYWAKLLGVKLPDERHLYPKAKKKK